MRAFVTGIAGFLGSWLAEGLLERAWSVCGVDNLIGGEAANVPAGAEWYTGDCNDLTKLKRAMRGSDVVFHLAATAHEGLSNFAPHENAMHGYAACAAVFSAVASTGVKRCCFTSSMARYGKSNGPPPFREEMAAVPEDPYGIGKLAAEHLLKNLAETHGFEYSICVPHNIHGPKQMVDPFRNVVTIFANRMLQKKQPIIYGDGSQRRSFTYVTDCVEPLIRMGTDAAAAGEVINIGPEGDDVTILRVAEIVARELDFPLDPIFKPERPREVKVAHCACDKARRLLGYEPRVDLQEGIRRTVRWLRERGPRPFSYHHLGIEIESARLPETWAKKLL